jgi:hypothetical protein
MMMSIDQKLELNTEFNRVMSDSGASREWEPSWMPSRILGAVRTMKHRQVDYCRNR